MKRPETAIKRFFHMTEVEWVLLTIATFLMLVFVITTVDQILLVGACGVGPAAPADCTWQDRP